MDTIELIDGGIIAYEQSFLPEELAQEFFEALKCECQWEPMPASAGFLKTRFSATYGDHGVTHNEAGMSKTAQPWTPTLLALKERIESIRGRFNYCYVCYYKSGSDDVTWHADDTNGTGDVIASLSLGAERSFRIRHRVKRNPKSFTQGNGTLIIMAGTMQKYWQHEVRSFHQHTCGERMKLTFRLIET